MFSLGLYLLLPIRASPGPALSPSVKNLGDKVTLLSWSVWLLRPPWSAQGHTPKTLEQLQQQLLFSHLWRPCLGLLALSPVSGASCGLEGWGGSGAATRGRPGGGGVSPAGGPRQGSHSLIIGIGPKMGRDSKKERENQNLGAFSDFRGLPANAYEPELLSALGKCP